MQLSVGDTEGLRGRKSTRREVLRQVIPRCTCYAGRSTLMQSMPWFALSIALRSVGCVVWDRFPRCR